MNFTRISCIVCLCVLLLFGCKKNNFNTSNSLLSGKIDTIIVSTQYYTYTFHFIWDSITGKLLSIGDSMGRYKFTQLNPQLLEVDILGTYGSRIEYHVHVNSANKVTSIKFTDTLTQQEDDNGYYFFYTNGILDSTHYPTSGGYNFSILDIKSFDFKFDGNNCLGYINSSFNSDWNGNGDYDTCRSVFQYSGYINNNNQLPYQDILSATCYGDIILYFINVYGYTICPVNRNLLSTIDGFPINYTFNANNQVSEIRTDSTLPNYKITYY